MIWQVHPQSWQREAITKRVCDSHMGWSSDSFPRHVGLPRPVPALLPLLPEMAFWSHNQKSCVCERTRRQHNRCSKECAAFGSASCVLIFSPFFPPFVHAILFPSNEDLEWQTYEIVVSASTTRCTGSFIIPDCLWLSAQLAALCLSFDCGLKWGKIKYKMQWYSGFLKELELRSNSSCWMQWLYNSFFFVFFFWQL